MLLSERKKRIKVLLWAYFLFLIFEGALRKWFLPFLSTPLLLLRDPIALLSLFWAWPILVKSIYWEKIRVLMYIGGIAFVITLYFGHRDWFTALYGLRIFWIQLPLIFVFPLIFSRDDVIKVLWSVLIFTIPMVILITFQSSLPPTHILNVGPGGVGSSAFTGAAGKYRPSGIFSFTNSVTTFFTFGAASLMALVYGFEDKSLIVTNTKQDKFFKLKKFKNIILVLGVISLVVALPISISRGLMANYGIVIVATIIILVATRTNYFKLILGLVLVYSISTIALSIPVVKDAADAFAVRWELAASSDSRGKGNTAVIEDQFQNRILMEYLEPIKKSESYPLLGHGLGMGTNIGAVRLTGSQHFLLAESSWGRQMGELGLFIGPVFILWRILFSVSLLKASIKAAFTYKNKIPIILLSMSVWGILIGQLGQSSALGFIIVTTGLTMASMINQDKNNNT